MYLEGRVTLSIKFTLIDTTRAYWSELLIGVVSLITPDLRNVRDRQFYAKLSPTWPVELSLVKKRVE